MEDLTKKHFDAFDGGVALVIFVALQYIFYFLLSMFPGVLQNDVAYIVLSLLLESLFFAAALIIASIRKKPFFEATTMNKKVNWPMVGLCLVVSVLSIIMFSDLSNAFSYTLEYAGFSSVLSDVTISGWGGYLLNIITVCAVPAICEEVLFRGVVLNSFRGISKWGGILVSGFTFMIMHGNPDQTIHQLLLGIALAYIVWETKNIWCGILIHFFNNFVAITISFIYSLANGGASGGSGEATPISVRSLVLVWLLGLAMAAVGFVLIWLITKYIKKQSNKVNEQKPAEQTVAEISVDGSVVQTEVVVEKSQEQQEEIQQVAESAAAKAEPKQQLSPLAIVFTVASYVAFLGYFVYEWISVLIKGLGA